MWSLRQQIAERACSSAWGRSLLLATAIGAAAVASGCGSDSAMATTGPTQVKCQVALSAPSSSIGPDGGTGTVTVTTSPECPWDVSTGVNWLSGLSPTSGQGTGTVEFRVAPNPLPSVREGEIVVNGNQLRVSQHAAACRFELRPGSVALDAAGGTQEVAVSAASGCSWTIGADANWISFTTPVAGSGDGKVGFSIAPNPGDEQRIGTIAVGDQRFTVTQAAAAATSCSYTIGLTTDVSIAAPGGTGTVAVSTGTGCAWTATSNAAWVTLASGASGTGNGAVAFSVAANPGSARTGSITVAGQTFTVTQAAAAVRCTYTIGPKDASIAAPGGTGTVTVSTGTGCDWTASSNANWITVASGASGTGNGSVAFGAAVNPGNARMGTITVSGQAFTVTQAAAAVSCTYTISPGSVTMPEKKGDDTVRVSTGTGCAWTASSNANWITVESGASGTGSGSVEFSVTKNPGKNDRTGTLTIAGRTFTVTQKG